MSLSPASFRRRIAYDVINDYVFPALNSDEYSLEERKARAELLPGFIIAIMERLRMGRLREVVKKCIEVYRGIVELPEMSDGEDVLTWYKKCLEKIEGESLIDWVMRVALASHCILSYACIEEAIAPQPFTPMI